MDFEKPHNDISHGLTLANGTITVIIKMLPRLKLLWQKSNLSVATFSDAEIRHPQSLRGKDY
jgi:hypothetical protein